MSVFDIPITSSVLPGVYQVATLPPAAANQAKYAYVTDLGGGADMCISDGTNWKHIRRGNVVSVAVASTITQTPLISGTIINMTGSGFNTAATVNLVPTNLYPGYEFTIVTPTGTLGVLGTIGTLLNGVVTGISSLLTGSWADYQYNGTSIIKLRGGSL